MSPLSVAEFGYNILPVTLQNVSCGVWIYSMYTVLSQRPNVFIRKSWIPFSAAVVAAPIRKLWPAYWVQVKPIADSAVRSACTKRFLVRAFPSLYLKKGPGWELRMTVYPGFAAIGHMSLEPFLKTP